MLTLPLPLVILLIVVLVNLALSVLVLLQNHRSASNRVFAALSLVMSLWLVAAYLSFNPVTNLQWSRYTIFFATIMSTLFFILSHTIPHNKIQLRKKVLFIIAAVNIIVLSTTLSPFTFTGLEQIDGNSKLTLGPGMALFSLTTTFFAAGAILFLFKKRNTSVGVERQQFGFVLIGIFMMLGLVVTTIMLPVIFLQSDFFVQFAPLYGLIFLAFAAYAIVRHHLFDIRVIVTETLIFALWLILFIRAITATTLTDRIIDFGILAGTVFIGTLLIRGTIKEIKSREEIEKLAHNLEKANVRLKELDNLKSEFVSIASHQLRSPLTAMKGYASLILEGSFGEVPKGVREAVQKIYDSSRLMVTSVQDFLDVSRIEQGKMRFKYEVFDAKELLRLVVEEQMNAAKRKGVALTFDGNDNDPCMIRADYGKIKQIFTNLIDNSLKYTPKGAITARIEKINLDRNILVSISDTGVGMTKATQARLFQKFTRAENAYKVNVSGTGLGLYVVQQMIEAHGGTVWAHSDGEGKGSTFYVQLDAAETN